MKLQKLLLKVCLVPALLGFIFPDILRSQIPDATDKAVKIGLLIQSKNSKAAKQGAEMAIRKANEKGGLNGKPFQLVIRSMEGPWGTGSKQAVNLIFEENVWAIMGSHDGRNAHLVEQVTTKARIPFLSAWSSDPTLSQAFIPWFFSCVPNDLKQADALIEEIYRIRRFARIAVVSDKGYDSNLAVASLLKKNKSAGKAGPLVIYYDASVQEFNDLADTINKARVDAIVLYGKPSASLKFMEMLENRKMKQTVFGAISLLDEDESSLQEQENYRNIVLFVSGNWSSPIGRAFRKDYLRFYGNLPGAVAAYSYDGMSILIDAVKSAGLDRQEIQKSLTKIHFEGVTGLIQFDDKGNREGTACLMEIKNGLAVSVVR